MGPTPRTPLMFIFFILLGGLLGGILGEIFAVLSPEGAMRDIFIQGYYLGVNPPLTLDLELITLSIGFTIRFNLFTMLGIVLGLYLHKQI